MMLNKHWGMAGSIMFYISKLFDNSLPNIRIMMAKLLNKIIIMSKYALLGMVLQVFLFSMITAREVEGQNSIKNVFLNIDLNGTKVQEAFGKIEKATEFTFSYKRNAIGNKRIYSIHSGKSSLADILLEIGKTTKLKFRRVNETIHVSKSIDNDGEVLEFEVPVADIEITGKITDENGEGLPGASVVVKGTTVGINTDLDGNYKLSVPEDAILTFSFVGYKTQEIPIAGRSTIDIQMIPDAAQLEEVVVVGYGEVKKSHLTAAVDQVGGETLQNRPLKSIADGLQGLVAGLNVQAPSGAPEAKLNLNIRGFTGFGTSASPLILVDGIERDISDINPNDVESVSVLKDGAASAIYGSRAPFGIVMITTKNGKNNESVKINYSSNYRFGSPTNTPDMMDSYIWAERLNEAFRNQPGGGTAAWFSELQVARMRAYAAGDFSNSVFDGLDPNEVPYGTYAFTPTQWGGHQQSFANVDWFDETLKKVVPSQQQNLSFSGGGKSSNYYVGLGFNETNGIFKGVTDFKNRYSALIKVSTDITKWMGLNMSANYVKTDERGPNERGNGRNYRIIWDVLSRSFQSWPTTSPNGTYYRFNDVPNFNGESGSETVARNDLTWTGGVSIKPLDGWEINGKYTWRYNTNNFERTQFVLKQILPNGDLVNTQRTASVSSIIRRLQNVSYHTIDLHTSYTKTVNGVHNFYALLGYQEEQNDLIQLNVEARDFFTERIPTVSTAANLFNGSDRLLDWSTRGLFGRFSYNYDEKYFIEFNGRRDATSRFAASDRWGFFPSLSAAWNISREAFWPISDVVSGLKIRGSWANSGNSDVDLNGNNSIDDFEYYLSLPSIPITTSSGIILDGEFVREAGLPNLVNSQLTWAKPRTIGVGMDINAFSSRLEINYDWYQRTVRDQFGPANPLPEVLGTAVPLSNNAVSETRGWELSLKWRDQLGEIKGKPIKYNAQFRISDYVGYVVEYEHNGTGSRANQWLPGEIFGQNFYYESNGIMQDDQALYDNVSQGGAWYYSGDLALKDLNGDGQVNTGEGGVWYAEGDRVKNGFNYPRYRYGVTLGAEWNGFDLSIYLDGIGHWKTYTGNHYVFGINGAQWNAPWYQEHEDLGAWRPDNTGAFFPRNMLNNKNRSRSNDQYALDLSHLRIRNIRLGYNIPDTFLRKISLTNAYVYASAENLGFMYYNSFVKYDPQLISSESGSGYPPQRIISFGLNIGL